MLILLFMSESTHSIAKALILILILDLWSGLLEMNSWGTRKTRKKTNKQTKKEPYNQNVPTENLRIIT